MVGRPAWRAHESPDTVEAVRRAVARSVVASLGGGSGLLMPLVDLMLDYVDSWAPRPHWVPQGLACLPARLLGLSVDKATASHRL